MITDFEDPESLDAAEERVLVLVAEIQEIQAQLGDPLKEDLYSNEDDYLKWRKDAIWAMTLRLQHLRRTKAWIKKAQLLEDAG